LAVGVDEVVDPVEPLDLVGSVVAVAADELTDELEVLLPPWLDGSRILAD
jgi:hypothetical protein